LDGDVWLDEVDYFARTRVLQFTTSQAQGRNGHGLKAKHEVKLEGGVILLGLLSVPVHGQAQAYRRSTIEASVRHCMKTAITSSHIQI